MIRIIFLPIFIINISYAKGVCTGRFVNPVTDVCWNCIFPVSVGAVEIPPSTTFRPDTANFPSPICVCPKVFLYQV